MDSFFSRRSQAFAIGCIGNGPAARGTKAFQNLGSLRRPELNLGIGSGQSHGFAIGRKCASNYVALVSPGDLVQELSRLQIEQPNDSGATFRDEQPPVGR